MRLISWVGLGIVCGVVGCAQMKVTKVSQEQLHADQEGPKGFRYYLSRPYVLVRKPIVVSKEVTLLVLDGSDKETPAFDLYGPAKPPAEKLKLPAEKPAEKPKPSGDGSTGVSRLNTATGALEPVSSTEWASLRQVVMEQVARNGTTKHRDAVQAEGASAEEPSPAPAPRRTEVVPGAFADRRGPVVTTRSEADRAARSADDAQLVQAALDHQPVGPVVVTTDSAADRLAETSRVRAAEMLKDATPAPAAASAADLPGDIDVIFLPDMEEQYAIHNKNIWAKSSYSLSFKDGWQLGGINGEFDSTTVALELLKTIDTAVNTAKTVTLTGLDTEAKIAAARARAAKAVKDVRGPDEKQYVIVQVTRTRVIKPGLYRISKPWEMGDAAELTGCGLLAKLGLHTMESVQVSDPEIVTPPKP